MLLQPLQPKSLRGGLLFKVDGKRWFLAAEHALKVAPRPQVARFPGAPVGLLGLALSDGVIVPVLELGPHRGAMIIYVHRGEPLGLLGAADIESGMYSAGNGLAVTVDGKGVVPLDVEALYTQVHAVTWGASWGG
jgi:hypothetical protein